MAIRLCNRSARSMLAATVLLALLQPTSGGAAADQGGIPGDHAERFTRGLAVFEKEVRPLLSEYCLACHGGEKTKGGLSLATREELLKGGEDGPVVVPFDARRSRMVRLLQHREEPHMPEKKPALPPAAIASIVSWIEDGAPYGRPLVGGKSPAQDRSVVRDEDRHWWSFQPLATAAPPDSARGASFQHPIDRFIAAKASAKSLHLAPAADRRTLLRRASLDLTGLPPTPQDIAACLADTSPDAWSKVVERLLASPHYGERWARHWMDVARFAESSGFEHDYDREGAFHYRDFVIRALNMDLPFDEFLRWQLAGDEFDAENPLALAATGFLGAGVFPTQITANEVERTRYDALDDMLATTSSAFLGLSVGCARCHDHKFDPIPSRDYYRMLSTFTTTVRSVIELDVDPERTRVALARWEHQQQLLTEELKRYEQSQQDAFAIWIKEGARLPQPPTWILLAASQVTSKAGATFKTLDDGSSVAEGNNADEDDYTFIAHPTLSRVTGLRLEALAHPSMTKGGPGRAENGNIGLSRLRVFIVSPSQNSTQEVRLARAVADFEQNKTSLSAQAALDADDHTGWAIDPQFGKDHAAMFTFATPVNITSEEELQVRLEFHLNTKHNIGRPRLSITAAPEPALEGEVLPAVIARLLRDPAGAAPAAAWSDPDRAAVFDWWKRRDKGWRDHSAQLESQAKTKPDGRTKVLVCAEGYPALRMHTQGADFFKETYVLKRGNPELKSGIAEQGFLQVLMPSADATSRWKWAPPEQARFSGRRRALATWLTDVDNGAGALVARVAVNRLWQHHFGQGLVATPNDFGHTGTPPTHPELLDWLARELVRNGWRLKPLHTLLMTSATYQQSSARDRAKESADPSNQFMARRVPRRLEGEAVRDCLLTVSGRLDPTMYGKGTKDERSRRRSVYFTVKRSELIGSMVAFDQPEPLVSQGVRPVTTVAPQALMLLNGPQVRDWAEGFAQRVLRDVGSPERRPSLVEQAYELALGRSPTQDEARDAAAFLDAQAASYHGEHRANAGDLALADFCQVLFGLNEFAYEY